MKEFSIALRRAFLELLPIYIGTAQSRMDERPLTLKTDNTPVGEVDILAMQKLRGCIETHFPNDHIIGEEDNLSHEAMQKILADIDKTYWFIDPLDGTQNRELETTFGGMVARRKGNEILYAAIFQPMNERVYGNGFFEAERGYGAWRWYGENTRIQLLIASQEKLQRHIVMIEGSSKKAFSNPVVAILGKAVATRTNVSNCFSTPAVANGHASGLLVIDNPPWDTLPALLFIPEAGGIVTDWDGNPVMPANCGKIIATGNAADHEAFLKLLNP